MNKTSVLETDALLGVMSGMRTTAAQVAVADEPAKYWLAFAGELVADKLPITPNRTDAGGMFGRIASAAFAAGRNARREERSPVTAAVTAGVCAALATKILYELRRGIGKFTHLPDPVVAVAEDALAVTLILRQRRARADGFGR